MSSDLKGTGLSRSQYEALEETAMLLQDLGYELKTSDEIELAGKDLESAATDMRMGDLASAAGNIESAAVQLQDLNTDRMGSKILDAGQHLDEFLTTERGD